MNPLQLTPPTHSTHYHQQSASTRTDRATSPHRLAPTGDSYQLDTAPSPRHSPIFRDESNIDPLMGRHSPTYISVTINPKETAVKPNETAVRPTETAVRSKETAIRPTETAVRSKETAVEPEAGPLDQVIIQTSDRPINENDHSRSFSPVSPTRRGKSPTGRGKSPMRSRSPSPRPLPATNGDFSYPPPTISGDPPPSIHTPVPTTRVTTHTTGATFSTPPLRSTTPPRTNAANISAPPALTSHRGPKTSSSPSPPPQSPPSRTPMNLTPPRHSPVPHPPKDNTNGSKFIPEDSQFAVRESVFNTTQPKDYVEDPSMDSHFKKGDYSPKHSSSVDDGSDRKPVPRDRKPTSQEKPFPRDKPFPKDRRSSPPFRKSSTDEELIEDVRKVFTSATPDLSLTPRTTPTIPGSHGGSPTRPLTPLWKSESPSGDVIDHGGVGGSPHPRAHPRRQQTGDESLYNAPPTDVQDSGPKGEEFGQPLYDITTTATPPGTSAHRGEWRGPIREPPAEMERIPTNIEQPGFRRVYQELERGGAMEARRKPRYSEAAMQHSPVGADSYNW